MCARGAVGADVECEKAIFAVDDKLFRKYHYFNDDHNTIVDWNNDPETTHAQIISRFMRAIKMVKNL